MKRGLLSLAVGILFAGGVAAFLIYRTATATSSADKQLHATAKVLMPVLTSPGIWTLPPGPLKRIQRVLDAHSPEMESRHEFAVVCWASAFQHQVAPHCVHESGDGGDDLVLRAAPFEPNGLVTREYATESVRAYAVQLPLARTVVKKTGITATLYVFQVAAGSP